ncbi:MAG: outer membrane beta-barrel protein [Gemmatimonadota bacterium]
MARAPRQFRLALTGGLLAWNDERGVDRIDDRAMVGFDLENRIQRFFSLRLGAAYGRTTVTGDSAAVDADQYVVDLTLAGHLAIGPLQRLGVVPFGTIGIGAVVHAPDGDGLATKSQSAAVYGGGLDADLTPSVGLRAEWRRYRVNAETIFDPTDRTGTDRSADRFFASLYLKL